MIKGLIKKYFGSLVYFYSHLKYRIFVVFGLSLLIGILDGLGLTMFLPLLQMVNDSSTVDPEGLGKLSFLVDSLKVLGIELNLLSILMIMAFFFFMKGLLQYISGIYKVNVQQRFISRLRLKNIKALNSLAYKYFVMSDIGRIQNTLTGEVDRVARAYITYFTTFQYGILVIVYMTFAFFVDAQFAILVTAGGILTNFMYKKLYKHTKGTSRKLTGDANIFQSLIIQNVSNFKYLKATGALNLYEKKLAIFVKKIESSNMKIGKLDALLMAGREPILIAVVVTVIYIQTTILGSSLGPILISLIFFYRALNYLMQLQMNWNRFLAVSGSLENMSSFEKELRQHRELLGHKRIESPFLKLELNDVSFFYNSTKILDSIDLKIAKNEIVAFVGESGSGKTTLVNVIAGLLPVERGEFLINGTISTEIELITFQKKIGYITQDSVVFNDTIFNNVTLWSERSEDTIKKFWEAIKKASLLDFVQVLPAREDEVLGSNGVNLSGGQKQRISIARELFKEVEILILDEATSALDSETEKAIQKNIDNLKGQYTIIIIAHRIATVKNADKIIVMKNGQISKQGPFNELIESSPYFKKLVELQEI